MKELLKRTETLYEIVKAKGIHYNMRVSPQQELVERHVEGLGFKLKNRSKKTCEIIWPKRLATKQLELDHYSLQVSTVLV